MLFTRLRQRDAHVRATDTTSLLVDIIDLNGVKFGRTFDPAIVITCANAKRNNSASDARKFATRPNDIHVIPG